MSDDPLNEDQVTLALGKEGSEYNEIHIATGYEIHQSLIAQPSEFSLRLGRGSGDVDPKRGPLLSELLEKYPPNTPFRLSINGTPRMTGKTDGRRATTGGNAASELTIFGRDALAPMHDAHIAAPKSFTDSTYTSLVKAVLKEVGLDPEQLNSVGVNANRKLTVGVSVRELLPVRVAEEIVPLGTDGQTAGATALTLQSRVGERWMDFVRKQLDRAGLFLWSTCDGKFLLSAPNPSQDPVYRITRMMGQTREQTNVIHVDYLDDTRPRYSYAVVYGKGGSRKSGPKNSIGNSTDDLMVDYGYSTSRALVIRDGHCQNNAQAAYLAQRKLAEGRRHGFQLVYTMAGLTTPAIGGGRAIWTPDTVVSVDDEELGIHENFWIESVSQFRNPHTTTTIRLMHTYDVVFGTPDFEGASGSGVQTGFKAPEVADIIGGFKR